MPLSSEWPEQQSNDVHSASSSFTSRIEQSLSTDPLKMLTPFKAYAMAPISHFVSSAV